MDPDLHDGWLRVAYDGPDLAVIEMEAPGTGWKDAYLDFRDGRRCAQIRWDADHLPVFIRRRKLGTEVSHLPRAGPGRRDRWP